MPVSACRRTGHAGAARDALHARDGEPGVVRARDDEWAVEAGGVEVQPRLCADNVRFCDEFEAKAEAGRPFGGLRVAEADVTDAN